MASSLETIAENIDGFIYISINGVESGIGKPFSRILIYYYVIEEKMCKGFNLLQHTLTAPLITLKSKLLRGYSASSSVSEQRFGLVEDELTLIMRDKNRRLLFEVAYKYIGKK